MNTKLAVNTELRIIFHFFLIKMQRVYTGCKTSLGRFPESSELEKKRRFSSSLDAQMSVNALWPQVR